jgi:hypothetical protein
MQVRTIFNILVLNFLNFKFLEKFPSLEIRIDIFRQRNVKKSMFRILFLRGDIPCHRSFMKQALPLKDDSDKKKETFLLWKVPPQDLDYCHYLPIFFDGYVT